MSQPMYSPLLKEEQSIPKMLQRAGIDKPPEGLVHALEHARAAYSDRSETASRDAHSAQAIALRFGDSSNEEHKTPGGWQKDLSNSGLDGLITGSIVLAGCAGASLGLARSAVVTLGVIFVQGLSLAVGEYLSARSYFKYVRKEFDREQWEMENYPEGEVCAVHYNNSCTPDSVTEACHRIGLQRPARRVLFMLITVAGVADLRDDTALRQPRDACERRGKGDQDNGQVPAVFRQLDDDRGVVAPPPR